MVMKETGSFAVEWDDPADAGITWSYDGMHNPAPIVPLGQHLNRVNNQVVFGGRTLYVNGYAFALMSGPPMPSPEVFSRGLSIWTDDYVPRLEEFCRGVVARDYSALSAEALVGELDQLVVGAADHFKLTMVVILPFMAPTYELLGMAEAELGKDGPRLVGTLLQGHENATATAGLGLGVLAERAKAWPEVARLLRAGDYDGIAHTAGGPDFLVDLRAYLDEFGWRLETWSTVHIPTWAEDPSVPLALIARYLGDGAATPSDAVARSAQDRELARAEIEARLDPATRERFLALLERTQAHVSISESRAHWQLTLFGVLRRPILVLGSKLMQAGIIERPDDVFYLYWHEAAAAARERPGSLAAVVAERRAEVERWGTLTPPPFLGAAPPQDLGPGAIFARHFFGAGVLASTEDRGITGIGASRGSVTGRARVIASLADSHRLEVGDVLVCATTAAPWTPLFAVAGAVVTDTGGVLSHSAICAREFAIPA
ncbi:MAG: PEP-utilizing enzyme, partial [Dehalococcoidia bacterium]